MSAYHKNGRPRAGSGSHLRHTSLLFIVLPVLPIVTLSCLHRPAADPAAPPDTRPSTRPVPAGDESLALRESLAGGLIGSKHDFSQGGGGVRDLCLSCHTPHITAARAPLLESASRTPRPVILRQRNGEELDGSTLLCLSCHDGVTAKDVYTSAHSTSWAGQMGSQQVGSLPLSSHPIGVRYPLGELTYQPSSSVTADGRIKLPDGRLQCISCHDPHNTGRHPAMLVKSNDRSNLCLSCHRL